MACELRGCGQNPHLPFMPCGVSPEKAGHSSLACVELHRRKESGAALEQPTRAQGVVLGVASTLAGRMTLEERPSKPQTPEVVCHFQKAPLPRKVTHMENSAWRHTQTELGVGLRREEGETSELEGEVGTLHWI